MTTASWLFLGLAGALAVGDWWAVARERKTLEYVCKPGALAALVGVALTLDPAHDGVRAWFVAALLLSLAGDVLLMLPSDLFVAGLASFLLAHLAYVVGLHLDGGSGTALAVAAVPVVVVAGLLAVRFLTALARRDRRELLGPVVAYMVVISAMVVSALATGSPWAATGAVLFMASDSLIAETRFVRPRSWGPVTIMVTYHLGQTGLVLSLLPR